jgi:hypothetical protein
LLYVEAGYLGCVQEKWCSGQLPVSVELLRVRVVAYKQDGHRLILQDDQVTKEKSTMTAPHSLPFAAMLEENLAWASPDLLRQVTPPPAEAGGFSLRRVGVATDQPGP